MKKRIVTFIGICFVLHIFANPIPENGPVKNDIIKVNYEKKNAALAMTMSAIVPGAGQFYVDKSWTSYLFSTIEVALWAGKIYYDNKGDDETKAYEKYADEHYSREQWVDVSNEIITRAINEPGHTQQNNEHEVYNSSFFSLDENRTQHYYEDIGKYPKYFYGWDDWGELFIPDSGVDEMIFEWAAIGSSAYETIVRIGVAGSQDEAGFYEYLDYEHITDNHQTYIDMRADANDYYHTANNINFLIALNHIASSIDAYRVAKKYNRSYITSNKLQFEVVPKFVNASFTPMFTFTKRF